jgi:hypothetical protein
MCGTSWLFSEQMYSISSYPGGASSAVKVTVNGREYAPGSSIVIWLTSVLTSFRV